MVEVVTRLLMVETRLRADERLLSCFCGPGFIKSPGRMNYDAYHARHWLAVLRPGARRTAFGGFVHLFRPRGTQPLFDERFGLEWLFRWLPYDLTAEFLDAADGWPVVVGDRVRAAHEASRPKPAFSRSRSPASARQRERPRNERSKVAVVTGSGPDRVRVELTAPEPNTPSRPGHPTTASVPGPALAAREQTIEAPAQPQRQLIPEPWSSAASDQLHGHDASLTKPKERPRPIPLSPGPVRLLETRQGKLVVPHPGFLASLPERIEASAQWRRRSKLSAGDHTRLWFRLFYAAVAEAQAGMASPRDRSAPPGRTPTPP